MTAPLPMTTPAAHAVSAFPARALRVQTGANAGDPLPAPADSVCGDYYRLDENAAPLTLMLDLVAETGAALLLVTHSERIAARLGRRVHLTSGALR